MVAGLGPPIILLWIVLVFVSAAIIMWLWNITIPDVFGLRELQYWQAFRLLLIAGLLFGAFHLQTAIPGASMQL